MSNEAKNEMGITEIAQRISEWATKREIPIKKLVQKYPGLGGRGTFVNIREGRGEYDVAKWLPSYRAALSMIEAMTKGRTDAIYDDVRLVREMHRAIEEACRNWDINRVVMVQGESGTGKSTAARILSARYGDRVLWFEASETLNDRPSAFLADLLKAMEVQVPVLTTQRLEKVQEYLCGCRRCLIIDEAHHLGPRCLNTLKTLVNRTPGEFVLLAIPLLWQRLESKGCYLEARQISTNRLAERVKYVLGVQDVVEFLTHAVGDIDAEELRKAANQLRLDACNSGNMSFLRELAREVERRKGRTAKDILEASERVKERR